MARLAILTLFMGQTRNRSCSIRSPARFSRSSTWRDAPRAARASSCAIRATSLTRRAVKAALERKQPRHRGDQLRVGAARPMAARRMVVDQAGGAPGPPSDDFKRCIDVAREIGAPRITNCPLNDGIDYAFELDFARAYETAAECYAEIADHDPSFPICIEYKDQRAPVRSLLATPGRRRRSARSSTVTTSAWTLDVATRSSPTRTRRSRRRCSRWPSASSTCT